MVNLEMIYGDENGKVNFFVMFVVLIICFEDFCSSGRKCLMIKICLNKFILR